MQEEVQQLLLPEGPLPESDFDPHDEREPEHSSKKIITIFNFVCQTGICIIYYLFSCEVAMSLANQDESPWNKVEIYIAILALPLLILVIFFHNMKLISIISMTG